LKNKFLEIAMIFLISKKNPRTDAIALKKKIHLDQSRAMFNETTFKSLLYFSLQEDVFRYVSVATATSLNLLLQQHL
jgi:hypothetical protein